MGESDDLYAWLIRGFVEAGLPDHTRGGRGWTTTGALNLENFIQEQGAGGIVLEFLGQAGESPSPEDEYTYSVSVVRGAAGEQVVVRCAETLFHHAFPGGDAVGGALAGHIVGQLRAHNDAFTAWRAQGGETTYAQRAGIPDVRGGTCDRALVSVLEGLRRANRSVVEGPANKWWVKTAAPGAMKIEVGLGMEPQYRTRKAMVTVSPEDLAHAKRLRGAGMLMILSGVASLGFFALATAFAGYNVYTVGMRGVTEQPWLVASLLGTLLFAGAHVFGGIRLRALRSPGLVRVLAVLGMLPCLAPCCGVGIPVGAWVLYLLYDDRSSKVFNE